METKEKARAAPDMSEEELVRWFPIPSQTSLADREFLLDIQDLVRLHSGQYSYLEIGSFLGGTLAPFLIDSSCRAVLSVDERTSATR